MDIILPILCAQNLPLWLDIVIEGLIQDEHLWNRNPLSMHLQHELLNYLLKIRSRINYSKQEMYLRPGGASPPN